MCSCPELCPVWASAIMSSLFFFFSVALFFCRTLLTTRFPYICPLPPCLYLSVIASQHLSPLSPQLSPLSLQPSQYRAVPAPAFQQLASWFGAPHDIKCAASQGNPQVNSDWSSFFKFHIKAIDWLVRYHVALCALGMHIC